MTLLGHRPSWQPLRQHGTPSRARSWTHTDAPKTTIAYAELRRRCCTPECYRCAARVPRESVGNRHARQTGSCSALAIGSRVARAPRCSAIRSAPRHVVNERT